MLYLDKRKICGIIKNRPDGCDMMRGQGEAMDKEFRRLQDRLYLAGVGAIVFGMWSSVKILMYFGLDDQVRVAFAQISAETGMSRGPLIALFATVVAVIVLFGISCRLYVGLSAVAESKGKEKSAKYIIFTCVMLIFNTFVSVQSFVSTEAEYRLSMGLNMVIEISSILVLAELAISGIKFRRLSRSQEG